MKIAALLGSVVLVVFAARDATACSVCLAGDPHFSAHGSASQPAGRVAAYTELRGWQKSSGLLPHGHDAVEPHAEPVAPTLARVEWEHIQRVLTDCSGNVSEATRRLGLHRRALQRKAREVPAPALIGNESRKQRSKRPARFPRSEPQASGDIHEARVRN